MPYVMNEISVSQEDINVAHNLHLHTRHMEWSQNGGVGQHARTTQTTKTGISDVNIHQELEGLCHAAAFQPLLGRLQRLQSYVTMWQSF